MIMATTAQMKANRNNAKKPTGPRTEEGKTRVATNALKHGLLARDTVLPGEDPADFDSQLSALEADIHPPTRSNSNSSAKSPTPSGVCAASRASITKNQTNPIPPNSREINRPVPIDQRRSRGRQPAVKRPRNTGRISTVETPLARIPPLRSAAFA